MISASRPWNTACTLVLETAEHHCSYCRKVMKECTEIDHRESYTYRNCDCLKAMIQYEIESYVGPSMPEPDFYYLEEVKYKNELFKLNKRYNK